MFLQKPSRLIDHLTQQWRALLAASSDRDTLRRATLCMVPTGGPIVVGVAMGQAEAGLIGGVIGIFLYFADADGGWRPRFSILALCVAGLLGGTLAGHLVAGSEPLLYIGFAIMAFASGFLYRRGNAPGMAMQIAAIAMSVSFEIAKANFYEIAFSIGAVVVVVLTRLADHWLFGPLPLLRSPVDAAMPTHDGWIRFGLAYGSAAVFSLWIGMALDPSRAFWVVTTTMLVMKPDARLSYVRVVGRITGTFAGVVGAWLIIKLFGSPVLLCGAVLILAFLTPHHFARRYWLHTAVITALILIAYDFIAAGSRSVSGLFIERVEDMLVGAALALVATAAAFPPESRPSEETRPRRKRLM